MEMGLSHPLLHPELRTTPGLGYLNKYLLEEYASENNFFLYGTGVSSLSRKGHVVREGVTVRENMSPASIPGCLTHPSRKGA